MRRRASLGAAVLFALTVSSVAPALGEDVAPVAVRDGVTPVAAHEDSTPVAVRAGYHDDYARIAFQWPSPVGFSATTLRDEVEIRFDRPIATMLQAIPKGLPGLVTGATLASDGHTIRLSVSKPVELRMLRFGKILVVDLFDARPDVRLAIIPPAPPAPRARAVQAAADERPDAAPASAPAPISVPQGAPATSAAALAAIMPAAGGTAPAAPGAMAKPASTQAKPASTAAAMPVPVNAAMPASTDAAMPGSPVTAGPEQADAKSRSSAPFLSIVPRELGGFSRVVFDWDRQVDYKVERDGNDLVVRFNAPALIQPMLKATDKPRRFRTVDAAIDGEATVVRIADVQAGTTLRHFQRGNRIVLDLMDSAVDAGVARPPWARQDVVPIAKVTSAVPASAPAPAPKPATQPLPAAGVETADVLKPAPTRPEVARHAKPMPSIEQPRLVQVADTAPETAAELDAKTAKAEAPKPDAPMVKAAPPEAPPATVPEAPVAATPEVAAPTEAGAAVASGLGVAPAPHTDARITANEPPGSPALRVSADAIGNGVRLGFPFAGETGCAVFERLGFLWIVFSGAQKLDLAGLDAAGALGRAFVGAEPIESDGATVLRLALAPAIGAQVVRTGNTWLVELMAEPPPPLHAANARVEPGLKGEPGRVILPITGAEAAITLRDPEVGDSLIVVPSKTAGFGVAAARGFVQFKLLASAQGAAIVPLGDMIKAGRVEAGIEITGPSLALSAEIDKPDAPRLEVAASDELPEPMLGVPTLFDYKVWRHEDLGTFNTARQTLQIAAADAQGPARTQRRLELARLLFAHGLAADALGVMDRVAAEDEAASREPAFLALRGATRLLSGRFDEAARDLDNQALDDDVDVTLWRGALAASQGDFEGADTAFTAAAMAFETLPTDFQRRFRLMAAQSALAVKNYRRAAKFLDELKDRDEPVKKSEAAEIAYLEAQIAEQSGHEKNAIADYDKLAEKPEGPVGVRAAFASIELKLERGGIAPEEAIAALERLRTAWRGDAYEQQVLRRLAALYAGKKDYMNALTALRDSVERFPDAPGTGQLRDQMHALMHSLFVAGDADALSPLEALGLYYEFEDSAPTGPEGGRIVEGLANKLIAIDLLDRAAVLLAKQVGKLEGDDKARLGGRLAEVRLLDGKPEDAIATLKDTESAKLAVPLIQERQRIAARAEAALGRPKQGLELIASDDSKEAALLRVELHWDDQDWLAVAATVDQLYPAGSTDPAALKPEDFARIMRAAVARALAHDSEGLGAMRTRFGDMMKQTAHAGAFDFITSSMAEDGVDLKELPKILANIDGIDSLTGKPAKTGKK